MRRPFNKRYPVEYIKNEIEVGKQLPSFHKGYLLFIVVMSSLGLFSRVRSYYYLRNVSP